MGAECTLILESWGPKDRNAQYNDAMDVLLSRLQALQLTYISANVISRNLINIFPVFEDRSIILNGTKELQLTGCSAENLRKDIGREQANLKVDPSTSGGNRTKRILLYHPLLSDSDWQGLASGELEANYLLGQFTEPTENINDLEYRVAALSMLNIPQPIGNDQPQKRVSQNEIFVRDPVVRTWVLRNANGICELCGNDAPFQKEDGSPYLEVHHVLSLAEGGRDTISNTVALCPNCHMEMHFGSEKNTLKETILNNIERLLDESGS